MQKRQAEALQQIQAHLEAKERHLATEQFKIEEDIKSLHDLTDVVSADFTNAQSAISETLSASLQDLERGQRNLQDEWVTLIEQQQSLASRERKLQQVVTMRVTTQLSHKLNRLHVNAKRNFLRSWMFYMLRCSNKRFKLHIAFQCRYRRLKQAAFALWSASFHSIESNLLSSPIRIESFSNFQSIQQAAADREAQLLEKLRELQELYSSSAQRERKLENDLAQTVSACHQVTQRAENLEQKVALQSDYIVQHEFESHQLEQQCDALLASKHESDVERALYCKMLEEKDHSILQCRHEIQCFRQTLIQNQERLQNLQQQLREKEKEVDAIRLKHAAADERRLQHRRTEVMTRVVKRLGNRTLAAAFGAWVVRMHNARSEGLMASLQKMQNDYEQHIQDIRQHEVEVLQQQLREKEKEVDAIRLKHAAATESYAGVTQTSQQQTSNPDVQRSDLLEMIILLESSLQSKTVELLQQQQLVLDSQSRAQRLEEALQQTTLEYERRLQQNADEMAQLKLDHDQQLQQASQAFAQQISESTQQPHHHMSIQTPVPASSLATLPVGLHDENLESRGSSRRSSGSSNTSPVNNILRTQDQLKPRAARHVQKQPAWDSSQRSRFSSGEQQHILSFKPW
jgi:hypothetical protein